MGGGLGMPAGGFVAQPHPQCPGLGFDHPHGYLGVMGDGGDQPALDDDGERDHDPHDLVEPGQGDRPQQESDEEGRTTRARRAARASPMSQASAGGLA
jgi:hypothetical protein